MKVNTQQRAKLIETDDKPDAIAINVDAGNVFFVAPSSSSCSPLCY